jgi:hypothetical protein
VESNNSDASKSLGYSKIGVFAGFGFIVLVGLALLNQKFRLLSRYESLATTVNEQVTSLADSNDIPLDQKLEAVKRGSIIHRRLISLRSNDMPSRWQGAMFDLSAYRLLDEVLLDDRGFLSQDEKSATETIRLETIERISRTLLDTITAHDANSMNALKILCDDIGLHSQLAINDRLLILREVQAFNQSEPASEALQTIELELSKDIETYDITEQAVAPDDHTRLTQYAQGLSQSKQLRAVVASASYLMPTDAKAATVAIASAMKAMTDDPTRDVAEDIAMLKAYATIANWAEFDRLLNQTVQRIHSTTRSNVAVNIGSYLEGLLRSELPNLSAAWCERSDRCANNLLNLMPTSVWLAECYMHAAGNDSAGKLNCVQNAVVACDLFPSKPVIKLLKSDNGQATQTDGAKDEFVVSLASQVCLRYGTIGPTELKTALSTINRIASSHPKHGNALIVLASLQARSGDAAAANQTAKAAREIVGENAALSQLIKETENAANLAPKTE